MVVNANLDRMNRVVVSFLMNKRLSQDSTGIVLWEKREMKPVVEIHEDHAEISLGIKKRNALAAGDGKAVLFCERMSDEEN